MSAITEATGLASFEGGCHSGLRGKQGTDLAQPALWENPVRSEGLQAVLFSVVPPTPLQPREHPSMGIWKKPQNNQQVLENTASQY